MAGGVPVQFHAFLIIHEPRTSNGNSAERKAGMRQAKSIDPSGDVGQRRPGRVFRVVCPEGRVPEVEALLTDQGFGFAPEPITRWARVLTREPQPLGSSVAAFFGYLYIQDRSSLIPPLVLDPQPGSVVLDLCASPGGKTGFLAQMVGDSGLVVANEPNPTRYETLKRNLRQLNLLNVVSCRYPGEKLPFPAASFPSILVDAPCSGWGTVERNPRVTEIWTGEKIETLIQIQRRLLWRAVELLAPGGRLVYSTCTTTEQENEEQVRWITQELGVSSVQLAAPNGVNVLCGPEGLRVLGDETAQGFFISLLTKPGRAFESPHGEGIDARFFEPDRSSLSGAAWENLPPGRIGVFGDRLHFLHRKAIESIPKGVVWRGPLVGRLAGGKVRPDPRFRALLPAGPGEGDVVLDGLGTVGRLLSGQRLECGVGGPWAGLYRGTLPLCWLKRQGTNCLWTDRS
jgi:16S rRNA C967 or C1407 C5-methylase (RsmB/RsmF family)